jgi:hypothetical protein
MTTLSDLYHPLTTTDAHTVVGLQSADGAWEIRADVKARPSIDGLAPINVEVRFTPSPEIAAILTGLVTQFVIPAASKQSGIPGA